MQLGRCICRIIDAVLNKMNIKTTQKDLKETAGFFLAKGVSQTDRSIRSNAVSPTDLTVESVHCGRFLGERKMKIWNTTYDQCRRTLYHGLLTL